MTGKRYRMTLRNGWSIALIVYTKKEIDRLAVLDNDLLLNIDNKNTQAVLYLRNKEIDCEYITIKHEKDFSWEIHRLGRIFNRKILTFSKSNNAFTE